MSVSAGRLRSEVGRRASTNKRRLHRPSSFNTNKYRNKPKADGNIRRAQYFKVFRPERTMLRTIEKNTSLLDLSHKEYRAVRYIYYCVIPLLARFLWFPPDRERLQEAERNYYNFMLTHYYSSGRHKEPYRVQVWSFRSPLANASVTQQKL